MTGQFWVSWAGRLTEADGQNYSQCYFHLDKVDLFCFPCVFKGTLNVFREGNYSRKNLFSVYMWTGQWELEYAYIDANNAASVVMLFLWMFSAISTLSMHSKVGVTDASLDSRHEAHRTSLVNNDQRTNGAIIERHFFHLRENIFHVNIIIALVLSLIHISEPTRPY